MRKKLMFPFFLLLGLMQLTFAECPYENVEDCPYYGKDPYGVVYHTCPYNSTTSSEGEIMGGCHYYDFSNSSHHEDGWYMWNSQIDDYVSCNGFYAKAPEPRLNELVKVGFMGSGQLEITIFKKFLEMQIESYDVKNVKDKPNNEYNTNILKNFKFKNIDPADNKIKFSAEVYTAKYSKRPISKKKIRDYYVCAELDAYLIPTIIDVNDDPNLVEYQMVFETGIEESNITKFGGWQIALGTFGANTLIAPLIQAFAPSLAPIVNGILTSSTSPGAINLLAEFIVEYAIKNAPMENEEVKEFKDVWDLIQDYDKYGFFDPYVRLNSDGLVFGLKYNASKFSLILNDIVGPFNDAIGDNTVTTILDQVQDIALEYLGHVLNDEELAVIAGLTGQGINTVKEYIINKQEAYEYKFMKGFDLEKFNSTQNMLIVSLAGAGPFNKVTLNSEDDLIGIETLLNGQVPKSTDNYEDEIYQLPSYYTDEKTVAVIGYPWLSTAENMQMAEEAYLPNIDRFAIRISDALNKMATDKKLILIGKSMGAAQLEKITHSLNSLGVSIDLLVLVDPSAQTTDQSGSSFTRAISSNVKKVYNYRQVSTFPDNDGQNGFPISFTSPIKGADIIVGDVGNDIGVLPCEGVGHDDIDECEWVLNEIDRLIAREKGRFDNTSIVNSLLLD